MASRFQTLFSERIRTLEARAFGLTVTIQRILETTIDVPAIVVGKLDRTDQRFTEEITTDVGEREYRIKVADYKFGGVAVEPRPGDLITETLLGGQVIKQEVLPREDSPCFSFDEDGTVYSIHTKRVD